MTTQSKAVLTIKEVAEVLRITPVHAYELARTGEIPSFRVGRAIRVPVAAIDKLLGRQP